MPIPPLSQMLVPALIVVAVVALWAAAGMLATLAAAAAAELGFRAIEAARARPPSRRDGDAPR